MSDYVDEVIEAWDRVRPDLDTAPLEVVMRIERAAQLLRNRLDQVVAAHGGLSKKRDLDTLTTLRRAGPGRSLAASTLAAAGQLTSGGMTNRLDRLEAEGLVERGSDPEDRRGVQVRLTPAGEALVDEVFAASLEAQRGMLGAVAGPDQRRMAEALGRLLVDLGDVPIGIGGED